ncbi:MAG: YkvA family protein [Methylophilaceae bacterium]|nr:YkvA family protein [Methylophilaceae bacterium]
MKRQLKEIAERLKRELVFYQLVLRHPRTPKLAKFLLWLAVGYVLLPFDLIPDFLPVIGQIDDLIIVPGLIYLALKVIPDTLIQECRAQIEESNDI